MATNVWYFSGTAKWCKVEKPDPKFGNFEVNLYMDNPSWDRYAQSEMQNKVREDEDGKFVTFRRPAQKLVKDELKKFGPPELLDEDGNEYEGLIGNGSEVTVKVSVYDTVKGKGSRLEAVRIDKLVPYEGVEVHSEGIDAPF